MDNDDWIDFYDRFTKRYEEFLFYYKNKRIDISTSGYKGEVYLSYGNGNCGFIKKDYMSPEEFLNDKLFDGKTLFEVRNDLK